MIYTTFDIPNNDMLKSVIIVATIKTGASTSYYLSNNCALAYGGSTPAQADGYPTGKYIAAIIPSYAAGGSGNVYRGLEVSSVTSLGVFGMPNVTYTCSYLCLYCG